MLVSDNYIKNEIDYKPNAGKLLHTLKNMGYILALATTTTNVQIMEVIAIYDKYSDCDREEINKLADYKFSSYEEILDCIEIEKGVER